MDEASVENVKEYQNLVNLFDKINLPMRTGLSYEREIKYFRSRFSITIISPGIDQDFVQAIKENKEEVSKVLASWNLKNSLNDNSQIKILIEE